jgi:hypothetical protein
MDRNPVERVALPELGVEVLRTLPLVDDRNHGPGNAGLGLDGLIPGLGLEQVQRNIVGLRLRVSLAFAQRFAFAAVRALRSLYAVRLRV